MINPNAPKFDLTGYRSIDMLASMVTHRRTFCKPIKAFYLKPLLYDKFMSDFEQLTGQEWQAGREVTFDNINIYCGDVNQFDAVREVYYE